MWLLIFLFLVMTTIVGWCFFGYFMVICFIGLFRGRKDPQIPTTLPVLSLVVPCFNEESQIIAKLEDIRNLYYPMENLEVVFVDGGSTDQTLALLSKEIRPEEPYRVVRSPQPGKIKQLNYAMAQLKGEIVVNTDVDGRLSKDALKWIAAEFNLDENVLVVGAYCKPSDGIGIERYYWQAQNKGRFLENDALGSSIVIAQCYAFRRGLLESFPEDVVADDIYVAFLAHLRGGRVIYSRYAKAEETRTPGGYSDFLPHKFRKGNAFLRESLRFLYLLPEMKPLFKMMFITRIAQQVLLPWALIFWFIVTGVLLTVFRYDVVILGIIFIMALFVLTHRIFAGVRLPGGDEKYSFVTGVKGYFLTLAIMLVTGVSYPFFRQGSNYPRLKNRTV